MKASSKNKRELYQPGLSFGEHLKKGSLARNGCVLGIAAAGGFAISQSTTIENIRV